MTRNTVVSVTGDVSTQFAASKITGAGGNRVSGYEGNKVTGRPGGAIVTINCLLGIAVASGLLASTPIQIRLSGSTTGTPGTPTTFTVTPNGAMPGANTVNITAPGATLSTASLSFSNGATAAQTFTVTRSTDGASVVTITNTLGLVNSGSPITYTVTTAVVPSGIVQYISHDGDAVGNVPFASAPTNQYWNRVLEQAWTRGTFGDWMDSTQAQFGSSISGAVPYVSINIVGTVRVVGTVTALVQRWRLNGLNRGFYLRLRNNAFNTDFAGRTAGVADRPVLTVTTNAGVYAITARCNASWVTSSVSVLSSAATFRVSSQHASILQFDLSNVIGNVTNATLAMTCTAIGNGSGAGIVDVFEADPPVLLDPQFATPTMGYGATGGFAGVAAHANTLISTDFAVGKPTVQETYSTNPLDYIANEDSRTIDATRGTTYLRAHVATGALFAMGNKLPIVTAATGGGVTQAAQRKTSAHSHYRFQMESTFTGFTDRVKIPAMGAQLGYWVTTEQGYWQPVTGNGGFPGTGLKFINAAQGNRVEYHGHSSRLVVGYRCSDVSAYSNYMRVATYIYHLDQVGAFPTEDVIQGIVLKRGVDYDFDHFIQLNTYTGSTDATGNFATANFDGIYRLAINGYQCLNRTNYRWVKHPEFSVQGLWLDVYHGGTNPSDRDMHFRVNEAAVATAYIGPIRPPIQITGDTWTPNLDASGNVLTTDFNQLPQSWVKAGTNKIDDLVPAGMYPTPTNGRYPTTVSGADGLHSVISAWSGAAWDWVNGRMYIAGGGHGDSWGTENGVFKFDSATMRFTIAVARSAYTDAQWWNGSGFTAGTHPDGNGGPQINGSSPAMHTYHAIRWLPGSRFEGNTNGYFVQMAPGEVAGSLHIANLDTGAWKPTAWFKDEVGTNKDFSYATAFIEWPYLWSPGLSVTSYFQGITFNIANTEATLWNAASQGQRLANYTGTNIAYNHRANCQMDQRREMCNFGNHSGALVIQRYRLGQAADAAGHLNLAPYQDTITLAGDTADFTAAAFNEGTTTSSGALWEAGLAYDEWSDCLWVVGNASASPAYKLTGLNTNTWTVTKYSTGTTLTYSGSKAGAAATYTTGTYGRLRCFRIGGIKFLIRVSQTTNFAEIRRTPDN